MSDVGVRRDQVKVSDLWRPWVFQSEDMLGSVDHSIGQTIDLQTIDPQRPIVIVSAFLPDAQLLDQVVVHFQGLPDRAYTVDYPKLYVHDLVAYSFDELPQPGLYNVNYGLYRNKVKVGDSPFLPLTLVDSRSAGWRPHACSAHGLYRMGLVEAWIAPGPHRLTSGELVIRSIPGCVPDSDVSLDITQQSMKSPVAVPIGHITYSAREGHWSAILTDGVIAVTRGDLFRIVQPSTDPVFLNFALAF